MSRRNHRPAYIDEDGRLLQHPRRRLSPFRVALSLLVVATLCVTNPANEVNEWPERARSFWNGIGGGARVYDDYGHSFREDGGSGGNGGAGSYVESIRGAIDSISFSIFGADSSTVLRAATGSPRSSTTNYVFFSLERTYDGVQVAALTNRFRLCRFVTEGEGSFCQWVDTNFCHGLKAFDSKNRAFTAHRLLETAVILSALLSFCSSTKRRSGASFRRLAQNPLGVILSVFSEPSSWIGDLYSLNTFVYPALSSMERLLSRGDPSSDAARFYGASSLLVLGAGGLSNLVASWACSRRVGGLRGATSAALGYRMAAEPSRSVVAYAGLRMNPSEVLLAATVVGGISCVWGVNLGPWRWDAGSLAAWVCGGVTGNVFGKSLIERYGFGWFSFR